MDKQKRHNHPTIDQLYQYVAGGLSHEEQHQVEKAALQNQQIEDTLEGLQAITMAKIDEKAALAELRQRVRQRVEKKEREWLPYYYASAAAVVLAVGLGWWLVREQETPSTVATSVAEETMKFKEEASPLSATISIPEKEATGEATKIATDKPKKKKAAIAPTQQLPLADLTSESTPKEEPHEVLLSEVTTAPQPKENSAKITSEEKTSRTVAVKASAPTPINEPLFTLHGRVIDAINQQALVGGTVALVGQSRGAITDANGNFFLPNVRPNNQIIISSTGYQPAQIIVKDSIISSIPLYEDKQALSEVAVTSLPRKNQKMSPKNGWKAYNDYLKTSADRFVAQNLQVPRGRVLLGFTVDTTGKPKDFKNKNGANPLLFEEAVRIVKEGDTWTIAHKKKKPQAEKTELAVDF